MFYQENMEQTKQRYSGIIIKWSKIFMNAKKKGNNFERESAKILSLIVSEGKTDMVFWRTAGSGNFATINKSKYQKGDLCVINPEYPNTKLAFECKNLSKVYLFPIHRKIKEIIDECEYKYGNNWVILLKISNIGTYALSRIDIFSNNLEAIINYEGYKLNIYIFNKNTELNREEYEKYREGNGHNI